MALIETHRFGVDLGSGGAVKGEQVIVELVQVGSSLGAEIYLLLRVLRQIVESGRLGAFWGDDKLQGIGTHGGLCFFEVAKREKGGEACLAVDQGAEVHWCVGSCRHPELGGWLDLGQRQQRWSEVQEADLLRDDAPSGDLFGVTDDKGDENKLVVEGVAVRLEAVLEEGLAVIGRNGDDGVV